MYSEDGNVLCRGLAINNALKRCPKIGVNCHAKYVASKIDEEYLITRKEPNTMDNTLSTIKDTFAGKALVLTGGTGSFAFTR